MNYYGSYRKLLENSKQAIIAAIEIYNKPQISYREEIFIILLVNAWELVFLAILSKNKQRIFQSKEKNKDYQTWSFSESLKKTKQYFPKDIDYQAVNKNLDLLRKYRNKTIHYYNEKDTDHCIHVLAQAAIQNYRDLVNSNFDQDIINEVSLILLPLSFNEKPDFIDFFNSNKSIKSSFFAQELFHVMGALLRCHLVHFYFVIDTPVPSPKTSCVKHWILNNIKTDYV